MNQAEHTEFIAELVVEFGNLSPNELAVLVAEAQANLDSNVEDEDDEDLQVPPVLLQTFVSSLGTQSSPFPVDLFRRIVQDLLKTAIDRDPAGPDPGLSAYASLLRGPLSEPILVTDEGAIPEDKTLSYRVPCTLAHPGLCATKDTELLACLKPVAKELYNGIKNIASGTFFVAEFTSNCEGSGPCYWRVWFGRSHVRGSGPRMLMLSEAQQVFNAVVLVFVDEVLEDKQAITFLAEQWRKLGCEDTMAEVRVFAAPIDCERDSGSSSRAFLRADWQSHLDRDNSELSLVLFPPPKKTKASPGPAEGSSAMALRSLFADERRRGRARSKKGAVKMVLPKPLHKSAAPQMDHDDSDDSVLASSGGGSRESEEDSSAEDLDTTQAHRQKVDRWTENPQVPRLGSRRGREDIDIVHDGVLMSRIFVTNKHRSVQTLSGYSAWCGCGLEGQHPDTERS